MERNWSEAASAAFENYPWRDQREKERARQESELVAFGEQVEMDDLPLEVRHWQRRRMRNPFDGWSWHGEGWRELTEGFERKILTEALAANNGAIAATARALRTTTRIVGYKAHKYGLLGKSDKTIDNKKKG